MVEKISEKYNLLISECKNNNEKIFEIISVILISLWYIYPLFFSDIEANTGERLNPSAIRVEVPYVFIGVIGLSLILIYILKKNRSKTLNIKPEPSAANMTIFFFILMLIWEYLSSVFCGFNVVGLNTPDGLIHYLFYAVYFFIPALFLNSRLYISAITEIMVGVASFIELVIITGSETLMKIFHLHPAETIFFNQNLHGYYLSIIIPAALFLFTTNRSKTKTVLHGAELILVSYGMINAQSTGPLLAIILSILTLIIIAAFQFRNDSRRIFVGTTIIAVSLIISSLAIKANKAGADFIMMFKDFKLFMHAILNGNTDTTEFNHVGSSRGILWRGAVQLMKERPLWGSGVYHPVFDEMERVCGVRHYPHNEFLDYGAQFGIPCMIFYTGIFISLFINGVKKFKKLDLFTVFWCIIVMSYLINSMFGNTLHEVYPFFMVQLGICWNLVKNTEAKS